MGERLLTESAEPGANPPGAQHLRGLYAATAISVTGDGVLLAAAPLAAASLTSNALQVAAVSAAGYAAWLLAGLPAGALVDRWALRRVMVTADLVRAATLLVLVVLIAVDRASALSLSLVVFALGVGSCFFDPAAQATIPALSGRGHADLRRLNGRYWSLDTLGRSLAGPPLGALLFAWARQLPFLVDAVSFLISGALVARVSHLPGPATSTSQPLWTAVREGLWVLWRQRELRTAALGMCAYNLGWSMANATLVLFATLDLRLSERQFGLVLAAAALGGVIGGSAHHLIGDADIRHVYALVLLLQSAAWALVGWTRHVEVLVAALVVVGFANTAISTAGAVTRQHHAPDKLLVRVIAGTRTLGVGSAAVGSLVGGLVASQLGLVSPFFFASAALLIACPWFAVLGQRRRSACGDPT